MAADFGYSKSVTNRKQGKVNMFLGSFQNRMREIDSGHYSNCWRLASKQVPSLSWAESLSSEASNLRPLKRLWIRSWKEVSLSALGQIIGGKYDEKTDGLESNSSRTRKKKATCQSEFHHQSLTSFCFRCSKSSAKLIYWGKVGQFFGLSKSKAKLPTVHIMSNEMSWNLLSRVYTTLPPGPAWSFIN